MKRHTPEEKIMDVVDACADCDVCRHLMDTSCMFFPELYRLWDRQAGQGGKISDRELRRLVDLCNFCGLCPCPNIRADIMAAKRAFIERDGLALGIRVVEDVERMARVCGAIPRLSNLLLQNKRLGPFIKKAAGIHEGRKVPEFPGEDFPAWARMRGLDVRPERREAASPAAEKAERKVAFFVGCTGRFLFPEVPRAAVEVLQHIGAAVYFPEQKCCGMPTMLEGDMDATLKFARFNIDRLSELAEDGYDIVCSCPTCGYMIRQVLKEGAYYSKQYQDRVGGGGDHLKLPAKMCAIDAGTEKFVTVKTSIFGKILKDDGCFSSIDPEKRILVAENTFDLGEYLLDLREDEVWKSEPGPVETRAVYYPPCHLREQDIGFPYLELLGPIPGLALENIEGSFNCCGIAGIMGFKKEFHKASIKMGSRLIGKIRRIDPEAIVTDCLSCRLQFNQTTPYPVRHPVEVIRDAYLGTGESVP